jgi:hypothetical protein
VRICPCREYKVYTCFQVIPCVSIHVLTVGERARMHAPTHTPYQQSPSLRMSASLSVSLSFVSLSLSLSLSPREHTKHSPLPFPFFPRCLSSSLPSSLARHLPLSIDARYLLHKHTNTQNSCRLEEPTNAGVCVNSLSLARSRVRSLSLSQHARSFSFARSRTLPLSFARERKREERSRAHALSVAPSPRLSPSLSLAISISRALSRTLGVCARTLSLSLPLPLTHTSPPRACVRALSISPSFIMSVSRGAASLNSLSDLQFL